MGVMETDEHRRTLLIVENEALVRLDIAMMLELADFRVLEAGNSVEALTALVSNTKIGVLVTGIHMPGELNGLALVRRVVQDHPLISSIVISGNVSARDAYEAGATDFISKPFMTNAFVAAVHKAFRRCDMRRKNGSRI
jgi:DNA-binding NtrC family response regulator